MKKFTKQQQQLIGFLVAFLVGGGYVYWNYMLQPTLENIKVRQEKYDGLLEKIKTAESQARRLPALQNELASLQVELSALEKQLPKDKDVPNIIRILTKEAMAEGLQFARLGPKPLLRQPYFEIIPFDLQFTGTLQAFARFLASLGQQERIFQSQNVSLSPTGAAGEQGFVPLSITFTVQTYAYSG